jgi:hypothetical protein
MATHKFSLVLTAATLLIPSLAQAYMNPYDVLLSNELLLPSTPRETGDRITRQQSESAARRDAEQAAIFAEQHPAAAEEPTVEEDAQHDAAPAEGLEDTPENREFLTLMRTLERITETQARVKAESEIRQQAFLLLEEQGIELHGGAPLLPGPGTGKGGKGLPPTGAGTMAAMATLLAGAAWTLFRARRTDRVTQVVS